MDNVYINLEVFYASCLLLAVVMESEKMED